MCGWYIARARGCLSLIVWSMLWLSIQGGEGGEETDRPRENLSSQLREAQDKIHQLVS